jgi:hypothetical protein
MEVIVDIPGGTLEKAALMYRMCRSTKELTGSGYEAPLERKVDLSPRLYLGCVNEANRRGISVREAAEAILASWLEEEAVRRIGEREREEAAEYKALLERNKTARRMVAQWKEADRLAVALGKQGAAYEAGRRAILEAQNARRREWRRRRKEAVLNNGSSDLQRF